MAVACIQLHERKMLTNKTTAPWLSFHGLKLHGTAALGFPVSRTTNACVVKPEYLGSCIMGHQLLVHLDDMILLLLTVKKNKEDFVVASEEGGIEIMLKKQRLCSCLLNSARDKIIA